MGGFRQAQEYGSQAHVAQVLAATATREDPIFVAPVKCRVVGIEVVPQAAATGDNTHTKNLNVIDKGSAGAGTTEVANKDLVTGVNLTALDRYEIPLNTTYAAGVEMDEGDTMTLQIEKVGNGIDVGPFLVQVDWIPV
jgi:hypothetical protein